MNLNMIRPKIETEDLLLLLTKTCQTLIEQTHTQPEKISEFKMIKPRETFHFNPPIQINGDWMVGLTDLEVYNSIFNITTAKKIRTSQISCRKNWWRFIYKNQG